jgi:hypothetical protein
MGLSALWETWKDGSDFGSESVGRFEIRTRFEWDKLSIAIQPPSLFFGQFFGSSNVQGKS